MSYRFEPAEPVAAGVKRMVTEQLDKALAEIDGAAADPHDAVHQVRKRCKKIRGVARLVRPALGDDYSRINAFYRDVARELSDVRDAAALVECFDDVLDEHRDEFGAADLSPVRRALSERRDQRAPETLVRSLLEDTRARLVEGREHVRDWPIDEDGFDAVAPGLRRIHGRGRKAMRRAEDDPTVEKRHEWRKRAKYLWYGMRVLRPLWPEVMKAWRDEADALSDLLGDDHDVAVVREVVAREPDLRSVAGMDLYLEVLGERSRLLRRRARVLGQRLYFEKPKRFAKRLQAYDLAGASLS